MIDATMLKRRHKKNDRLTREKNVSVSSLSHLQFPYRWPGSSPRELNRGNISRSREFEPTLHQFHYPNCGGMGWYVIVKENNFFVCQRWTFFLVPGFQSVQLMSTSHGFTHFQIVEKDYFLAIPKICPHEFWLEKWFCLFWCRLSLRIF